MRLPQYLFHPSPFTFHPSPFTLHLFHLSPFTFFTFHPSPFPFPLSPFPLCVLREPPAGHHLRRSQAAFVEQPDQALSRLTGAREEDGLVVLIHRRPPVISSQGVSHRIVRLQQY